MVSLGISILVLAASYLVLANGFTNQSPWTPERWRAFLDSVLAGLAGFVLVGGFTFLFSLKQPEEETLERRIAYLYSARQHATPAGDLFLRSQIQLLGAVISRARVVYRATETSMDRSLLRISASVSMSINNMMKFDHYRQVLPFRIASDGLPASLKELGLVTSVRTRTFRHDGSYENERNWLDHPQKMTHARPDISLDVELDIPPGSALEYDYGYEIWQRSQDIYWFGANRFIEIAEIHFANLTKAEVILRPHFEHMHPNAITLSDCMCVKPGETIRVGEFSAIPPTGDVTFVVAVQ